mgnify:CR=1 FL=1
MLVALCYDPLQDIRLACPIGAGAIIHLMPFLSEKSDHFLLDLARLCGLLNQSNCSAGNLAVRIMPCMYVKLHLTHRPSLLEYRQHTSLPLIGEIVAAPIRGAY